MHNMGFDSVNSTLFFLTCLLLASSLFIVKAQHNLASDDDSSFSYDEHSYNGPQHWGELRPGWRLCGIGTDQSPIDIGSGMVSDSPYLGDLIKTYKPSSAVVKKDKSHHEVRVQWNGDAGGILINGDMYHLLQCHWHTPTEHAFDGKRHEVELHIVHQNAKGKIAVVGILYKLGQQDPFLTRLLPFIKSTGSEEGINLASVDPTWIGFEDREYYRYNGSLTTPGCFEGVTWTVFKMVRTVSTKQVNVLRKAIKDGKIRINARPIQALNGRVVSSFQPTSYI